MNERASKTRKGNTSNSRREIGGTLNTEARTNEQPQASKPRPTTKSKRKCPRDWDFWQTCGGSGPKLVPYSVSCEPPARGQSFVLLPAGQNETVNKGTRRREQAGDARCVRQAQVHEEKRKQARAGCNGQATQRGGCKDKIKRTDRGYRWPRTASFPRPTSASDWHTTAKAARRNRRCLAAP